MIDALENWSNVLSIFTTQKMKFSIKICSVKMVTFTEKILNGKLYFLCSDYSKAIKPVNENVR